jgi:hypothetical protein
VLLVGGKKDSEGNLFLTNQQTQVYGPVCADYQWTIENVRQKKFNILWWVSIKREFSGKQPRLLFREKQTNNKSALVFNI